MKVQYTWNARNSDKWVWDDLLEAVMKVTYFRSLRLMIDGRPASDVTYLVIEDLCSDKEFKSLEEVAEHIGIETMVSLEESDLPGTVRIDTPKLLEFIRTHYRARKMAAIQLLRLYFPSMSLLRAKDLIDALFELDLPVVG